MLLHLFFLSNSHNILLGPNCYNLRLSSDCNQGKDLSRNVEMSQLVKHKDIELYLQLYILIDNEVRAR